jgi:hypothetical protein
MPADPGRKNPADRSWKMRLQERQSRIVVTKLSSPICFKTVRKGATASIARPVRLVERQSLPVGVVEDGVVGQQVQHPGSQALEALEPLAEVVKQADQDLDGGVVRVLLEPPGPKDFDDGLKSVALVLKIKAST